jgi:hypothetical protein
MPRRSTSPLRKFLKFIFGMCRSQHDIQVEQQRSRRVNKQMRDTMKLMHNAQGFQPPRSPPSPESPQVEIPSCEDRMRGWANSDMLNQYGPMLFESEKGQGSSSSVPPPLHNLHLLLRMWKVHLTSWNKSKHPHLLHLPSKDKIGALASPLKSLATILLLR